MALVRCTSSRLPATAGRKVINSFQGGSDGKVPFGGPILDAPAIVYGTTAEGGSANDGVVYELSPSNGGWTETILHTFQGSDGSFPVGGLIADRSGNLYGGAAGNIGTNATIFELSQPGNWSFQVLYTFDSSSNGPWGTLTFDGTGDLYGASIGGGAYEGGYVFKLTPSNGSWSLTDLHDFQSSDGIYPNGGLVVDSAGNLYGTAQYAGTFTEICYSGCGTIWEITRKRGKVSSRADTKASVL